MRRWWAKRRRGALAMVALAGLVPVTAMLSANANSAQMVDDRRQAQDAADALASLHATWSARSMNIISMNNVTTAQLMSISVGAEALFLTTTEINTGVIAATGNIVAHGVQHCTPQTSNPLELIWTGICAAQHTAVEAGALLAAARAADINSDFQPVFVIDTAGRALEAIDGMNRALAERHSRAMREIAEGYADLLEIEDHHFADPCIGPGPENCRRTNSRDGMALPLEEADFQAYAQLLVLMEAGTTTRDSTFRERGFSGDLRAPLSTGGTSERRHLMEHINHITEVGDTLYEFRRFYQQRFSHMIRRPFSGPGSGDFAFGFSPAEPSQGPRQFTDYRTDAFDIARTVGEVAIVPTTIGLQVGRAVPFTTWDAHPQNGYLFQPRQSRTNNSFHRNFRMLLASVAMGQDRDVIPLGIDIQGFTGFVFANAVPEIYRLRELPIIDFFPPVDPLMMPDDYLILAYSLREPSPRTGTTVFGDAQTDHTGYGQSALFNPDGASLYSQNWQARLMEATRLDGPRDAGRDLNRQAVRAFGDLAQTLRQVSDQTSWRRVNAH
ncbi:MAG: hypothetical protein AAF825_03750 [Pseudomonadota bacterium]